MLLAKVAERIVAAARPGASVSRLVGDEFGVLLTRLEDGGTAAYIIRDLLNALAEPFHLDIGEVFISATAGAATCPPDGTDPDQLLKCANLALGRAKERGRGGFEFYTPDMTGGSAEQLRLDSDLHRALERNEFFLQYQPKLDFASGAICGSEALLRWNHPTRGLVSPNDFIPLLERSGLIIEVGLWVIREACEQIKTWQQLGISVPPVAVNLSGRQFQDPFLDAQVARIIEETGIPPHLIEFEITESMLMQDPQRASETLRRLKELGTSIAVDDFGTGYSSLAYLKRFPVDCLKIDRTFVRDIVADPDDAAITVAVIKLAHSLRLKVIAEGVETDDQFAFLRREGCNMLQGYYFSRPLNADALASLISAYAGRNTRKRRAGKARNSHSLFSAML
jgi:EAL domain-containing protein (putative c-di-GMP-specific phosphodiesterase class I)